MLVNPELRRSGPDSEVYYTYDKARGGSYRLAAIAPGHFPGERVETLAAGETRSVIHPAGGELRDRVRPADRPEWHRAGLGPTLGPGVPARKIRP